ncbi:hypothetical protein F3K20_14160 [Streptomyces scabiei]|nr:hypothetical protein [Streptomyces sp. LBUM 1484]MBP5867231.1 hypothetical protein [Streptomyces sp. LBUM 1485]MBP5875589.1 hypothetical protein [Streptomyces sp. LBUM 1477]MBP5883406.1 hypothetical protein [Streptomyces sp. LBUM 1487]MBP5893768.1 hypothetical protein [Streptomyces sp. LBUM 1481]MBP5899432.1 hypothetical protein [Streptomyces sp. LBUM 1488]MBP5916981.1 hypothetical protein [Streptomyces sp. LBUM 1486]MBP5924015.1 hypothetical protein [Streptomyces sp. LBUM 1483]QTU45854.
MRRIVRASGQAPQGDGTVRGAEIPRVFSAESAPGHRCGCHHPVREQEWTRDRARPGAGPRPRRAPYAIRSAEGAARCPCPPR